MIDSSIIQAPPPALRAASDIHFAFYGHAKQNPMARIARIVVPGLLKCGRKPGGATVGAEV
jgi:hypothetical protein